MSIKNLLASRKFKIFGIILLVLVIPFRLTIAPERTLKIVESNGTPLREAKIEQNIHQYSLNIHKSSEFVTDFNGVITIPRRSTYTNIIFLVLGAAREILSVGLEAGFGSDESIGIFANGYPDTWFHNGEGLDVEIIVLGKMGVKMQKAP